MSTGRIDDPPDSLKDPTEYEKKYIYHYEELLLFARALINGPAKFHASVGVDKNYPDHNQCSHLEQMDKYGFGFAQVAKGHKRNIDAIRTNNIEQRLGRMEAVEKTRQLAERLNAMRKAMPAVVSNLLLEQLPQMNLAKPDIYVHIDPFGGLPEATMKVLQQNVAYSPVLFDGETKHKLLITCTGLEEIKKLQRDLRRYKTSLSEAHQWPYEFCGGGSDGQDEACSKDDVEKQNGRLAGNHRCRRRANVRNVPDPEPGATCD